MKKFLFTLMLTGVGVWAQFAPAPATTTNREELLREALRRAMAGKTNGSAVTGTSNKALPWSVDGIAPRSNPAATNRLVPPAARAAAAVPAPLPAAPIAPVATGPAAPAPVAPGPAAPAPAAPGALPSAPPAAAAAAPPATAASAPEEQMIPPGMINFKGMDINQALDFYADLVNRTILRPTSLPAATITLKTQTPLTKHEAIQALDTVLGMNGIAVVNIGDKFAKVVPTAQAGQVGAPFNTQDTEKLAEMGQYVTQVIQVTNAKPTEVVPALTPFASPGNPPPLAIDSSGILVLRDYTENVKRMLEMIKKIDVAVPSEFISKVIPIKYALASDIASALNSLSTGGGGTTVGGGGGGGGTAPRSGGMRSSFGSGFNRSGFGGYGGYGGYGGVGSPFTQQATTTAPGAPTPSTGSSFTQRLQKIISNAASAGDIQVIGVTKIIADERTNSLLVFASRADMKTIEEIVSKLDVVLAQVLIEAVIIQVNLNDNKSVGLSYIEKQPHGVGYFSGLGAINNGTSFSQSPLVSGATNLVNNSLPGGFSYLASLGSDLDVTLTAFQGDSRAKILQRPRIQTSHAVPASLFVGESRPYPVSSYYGGGAYGGYASIQQLQIGVRIEVTPLINPDGLVVMDIAQDIESFEGNVTIQGVGDVPVTSQKQATAKVAVRDRDTVMLGGLIENSKNTSDSGVPFLKDIPLLGYLFRQSSKNETRNELIVLIRPTVLPTPEIAALAARAEKDKMPEVKRAEYEGSVEESRRLKQADKWLKNRQ